MVARACGPAPRVPNVKDRIPEVEALVVPSTHPGIGVGGNRKQTITLHVVSAGTVLSFARNRAALARSATNAASPSPPARYCTSISMIGDTIPLG